MGGGGGGRANYLQYICSYLKHICNHSEQNVSGLQAIFAEKFSIVGFEEFSIVDFVFLSEKQISHLAQDHYDFSSASPRVDQIPIVDFKGCNSNLT